MNTQNLSYRIRPVAVNGTLRTTSVMPPEGPGLALDLKGQERCSFELAGSRERAVVQGSDRPRQDKRYSAGMNGDR